MKITGTQIILRDWQREDFPIYRFWNTGGHNWMNFNGPYYPQKSTEEVEKDIAKFRQLMSEITADDLRQRMVILDQENDKLIGTVSWYWQSIETNWKSIGIAIYDESFWGKGIGYEALSLWVDYLFTFDKEIVRLDLRTWGGHTGMIKLAKKLGFVEEARFRKARIVNGVYYDSIGMGILKTEWMSTPPIRQAFSKG